MSNALSSKPIMVFDIETVADTEAARPSIRSWLI